MAQVRKVVRLHPETVSNYKAHIKPRTPVSFQRASMRHIKIDMRVWQTAMKLAKDDATRIVVKSEIEVIVVNHTKRKG